MERRREAKARAASSRARADQRRGEPEVAGRTEPVAWNGEEAAFLGWLLGRCGVSRNSYREQPLKRRLAACQRVLRVGSLRQAREVLERSPALMPRAQDALLIGVTAFFRDREVFEQLHREVLPELVRCCRGPRIWSVGCSDGAELYSVAMLLGEMNALEGAVLRGTDCRASAIERATLGLFSGAEMEHVTPELTRRYFAEASDGFRISGRIRQSMQWQVADALLTEDESAWDLILCRNLAIYLEGGAAEQLWVRLGRALRPGGVLVVGKAERPSASTGLVRVGPCVYRRNGSR